MFSMFTFSSATAEYTLTVPFETTAVTVSATANHSAATVSVEVTASKEAYLKNKQNAAEERKRKNRLEKLKKQCEAMETELSEIDEQLSGEAAYDYVLVAKLDARKTELEDALLAAYEEIEELEE